MHQQVACICKAYTWRRSGYYLLAWRGTVRGIGAEAPPSRALLVLALRWPGCLICNLRCLGE